MSTPSLLALSLIGTSGAIGGLIMTFGLRPIMRERAARRWPRAPGVIQASSYEAHDGTSRDRHGYDVTSTTFTPVVAYEYTVDGRTYPGRRIRLASAATGNADAVKRTIDRYPPRARVQVFYDPNDPASAFLETGTSGGAIFLTAFGALFVALALLGVALVVLVG